MKKIPSPLSSIFLCAALMTSGVFLFAGNTSAFSFFENERVNVSEPQKDDVYIVGGEILVDQKVAGDVIAVAGDVSIFGDVSGDVMIFGGNVAIHGNVGDDVRVVGGNVSVKGNVGDDVVVVSGNVMVERGANLGGSVFAVSGMVTVDGNVHENIIGEVGVLRVRGWVDGDVEVFADQLLTFSSTARVSGNVKYYSPNPPIIPDGVVRGTIEKNGTILGISQQLIFGFLTTARLFVALWLYLALLLIGLFFTIFLPEFFERMADDMRDAFWKRLGLGFLTILVVPVVIFVAMMTIIGIPIGILLAITLGVLWFFSKIAVGYFVGNLFFRKTSLSHWRTYGRYALGLFVFFLVGLIPIFGPVLSFLLSLLAIGSFVIQQHDAIQFLKAKKFW